MAEENTIEQDNRDRDEDEADAGGADSAQDKAEQREDDEPAAGGAGEDQSEESKKAQAKEEERESAKETMKKLEEEGPPEDLEDWPDDAAKYETFGGPEGDHSYEEGPETKLGPSSLRHHESGAVTIEGEEVDDPDDYKGEPIPGGPTDEDAPQDLTTQKIREDQGRELESEKDGDEGDSDDDGGASASKESDDDG
ncbi:MAG: hypothetical protein QOE36_1589 [Gaiellaceae bacterium]|jgi:hypothetical protein|nr:hypothetical protein [Gaiellaceae bacterium]